MTRATVDLLRALGRSVAEDEAAADNLFEIIGQIEDLEAPHAKTFRTLARMHQAKAITNRALFDALALKYDRGTDTGT